MRSDPRHLLVLGGVSFLGLGLYHIGAPGELVAIGVLTVAMSFFVSVAERVE
jgi:hypothetical protein